jgi:hypothetical protein
MPHKSDDENVREFVKRRLNGIALIGNAADALEETQGAEDLSATDVLNRALVVYNDLRKHRDGGGVFVKDADGDFVSYSWE